MDLECGESNMENELVVFIYLFICFIYFNRCILLTFDFLSSLFKHINKH